MIGLEHYLALAGIVFSIGMLGMVFNRNNLIGILMCIELMLLAVNINFVVIDQYLHVVTGQVMVFFVLAVAAAEAAIGLALFILLYQRYRSIETDKFCKLKG